MTLPEKARRIFDRFDHLRLYIVAILIAITLVLAVIWWVKGSDLEPVIVTLLILITVFQGIPVLVDLLFPHVLPKLVYESINMSCHHWKNSYMAIMDDGGISARLEAADGDFWDKLNAASNFSVSDEYRRKAGLVFGPVSDRLQKDIEVFTDLYRDHFTDDFRLHIFNALRGIRFCAEAFQSLNRLYEQTGDDKYMNDIMFQHRLRDVIDVVGELSREADKLAKQ